MLFTWGFAGIWCLISFPMAPMAWTEAGAIVGLLFPAVGIGLVWYANETGKQWRRYGITRLMLDPYPGSIGGHVGGSIELGAAAGAHHNYEVTLECVHSYMSGSGKNRSRRYDVEWQARGPAEASMAGSGLRLEFRFDVPEGLPESEKKRGSYHLWRIQLNGDQQDVPLQRTFEIAVFGTAEASQHIQVDT
ncbi:MAG: hypothetical protein OES38_06735, partial [Gammaproteobacteria bacterium]|nr:hypothetical protein [Gammaproteobacteria bacterium]